MDNTVKRASTFAKTYFHGTKADLNVGDLIEPCCSSNCWQRNKTIHIFLTATLDAAIWSAELAYGEGRERIYVVEPTGPIEDDPDLTDKNFLGNPTGSYCSSYPLRVVGEVMIWQGHPAKQVAYMKEHLQRYM